MKILFVENHAVFADTVISTFLGGHVVEVVPTVAAAIAMTNTHEFDVAFVDYDLDDRKGDDLVAHLRAHASRIAIVGVSAHASGNDALLRAGADATCAKLDFASIGAILEKVTAHLRDESG